MAISVTTLGTNAGTTGGTLAIASLTIAAGVLIFFDACEISNSATGGAVADTPTNTYTQISFKSLNNTQANGFGQTFYVKNALALSAGTITYTKKVTGSKTVISGIYATGIDTVAPLDTAVTNTATGSSAAHTVSSLGTATQAGNLVVGFDTQNNCTTLQTVDAGNGWSASPDEVDLGSGANPGSIGGNQVNAGTGSNTFAVTGRNTPWAAFICAFKATPLFGIIAVYPDVFFNKNPRMVPY